MRVLVTGASGFLGHAVCAELIARGHEAVALVRRPGSEPPGTRAVAGDLTDATALARALGAERPDAVINCSAWTDVDGCELDPARAQRVNARGPEFLALACRRLGALLVTISTDYVFDGQKKGFYTQRDQPNPQSVYAVSKLAGERRAQDAWARTIVVRSGYIFGADGTNFLSSVIERGLRGEPLTAINDSFGTPTYAPDLAGRLYRLTQLDLPGIYHVVNAGAGASFAEFARQALATAGLDTGLIQEVGLDTLKRPAPRPRNSRLRCLLSEAIHLGQLPSWKDALREFVTATSSAGVTRAPGRW